MREFPTSKSKILGGQVRRFPEVRFPIDARGDVPWWGVALAIALALGAVFLSGCAVEDAPDAGEVADVSTAEDAIAFCTVDFSIWVRTFDTAGNEIPCTAAGPISVVLESGAQAQRVICDSTLQAPAQRIGTGVYNYTRSGYGSHQIKLRNADGGLFAPEFWIANSTAYCGTAQFRYISVTVPGL